MSFTIALRHRDRLLHLLSDRHGGHHHTVDTVRDQGLYMSDYDHPSPDSPSWDNPDFCPFCGQRLLDGGPSFVEHIGKEENASCRERFEQWRENVAGDIGGEWTS